MSKMLNTRNLSERRAPRTLLAVSLSFALAALGCTTDRNLGNGDPVTTPGLRTSPTGSSPGSETPPTVPPSMTSSFTEVSAPAGQRPLRRLTAEQAAMIMADQQPRVKVLGPASPGNGNPGFYSLAHPSGQLENPALRTNPQVTVNSSISSRPTPVILSGAGGSGTVSAVAAGGTAFTANGMVAGTTAASGLSAGGNVNEATATFTPQTNVTLTPTNAGVPIGAGRFAASPGALSPTASSAVNLPASASASTAVTALSNSAMTPARTATAATTTTGTTVSTTTGASTITPVATATANLTTGVRGTSTPARRLTTASATVKSASTNATSVRVVTGTNGRVTVTNVKSQ
jgi:hypothetical protein